MTVHVRLFAMLRDAAGIEACRLTLEPEARGLDAKTALIARYPRLQGLMDYARLAVNDEYRAWDAPLREGDELGCLPPASGG
jgi:molybdopterin converting factor small subunit